MSKCPLPEALALARPHGGTIDLATPGYVHAHIGNWVVKPTDGALITAPGSSAEDDHTRDEVHMLPTLRPRVDHPRVGPGYGG